MKQLMTKFFKEATKDYFNNGTLERNNLKKDFAKFLYINGLNPKFNEQELFDFCKDLKVIDKRSDWEKRKAFDDCVRYLTNATQY